MARSGQTIAGSGNLRTGHGRTENFRFNESPLFLLSNLEAIGPAVRIAGAEAGGPIVMPAIKAKEFNFTSLSGAV